MAIPFIKDEAEGTRSVAFWALVGITLGLAFVSLFGVWAEDGEATTGWIIVGKFFWSVAVVGAEFLAAMALQRAILAPTIPRKVAGVIVFLGLAWFCVHNVERGIHAMYPTIFKSDTQELRDLAGLAGTQATDIKTAATTAIASIPDQLATARTDLAKLEAELTKITANSTETSIKLAQQHLQGLGYYDGDIDGIWQDKTKDAVLRRGAELRTEITVKKNIITGLESGSPVTTTAAASEGQSKTQIDNEAKARKREEFGNQITVGAWVLEGARSLGWIVFVSGITVAGVSALAGLRDDIERQKLQNELNSLRVSPAPVVAATAEAAPEPVAPEPPPPPEMTEQERRSRQGGLSAQHNRRAANAERLLVIGRESTVDAALAMKVAAE